MRKNLSSQGSSYSADKQVGTFSSIVTQRKEQRRGAFSSERGEESAHMQLLRTHEACHFKHSMAPLQTYFITSMAPQNRGVTVFVQ